jgi:hypothetical protein
MEVLLATLMFVASEPPKVTVAPAAKLIPVMVKTVPPLVGPELGSMDDIAGAVGEPDVYVKPFASVTLGPP